MKKTLLYIGILAVLGFSVWFFLFREGGNAFGTREAGFNIRDTGAIGKIFIADNGGHSVTLVRVSEGEWKSNGYVALDAQIKQLLKTFYLQVPLHPVPKQSHNSIIKMLAGSGIKVEVYDREGQVMRVFYVGSEVQNFEGTYMLMDGAEQPFVVGIPGYQGFLTPRYSPNLVTWRDRTIFNIPAEEIDRASVQYAQEPLNSFTISRQHKDISVTIHPELMAGKTMNRRRSTLFLGFFKGIIAEGVVNGLPGLDSIIREMPKVATVEVTGNRNHFHQRADIYYYPMNQRSKNMDAPETGLAGNYDSDHFYAIINDGKDTVVVQQRMMTKIFRPGYEFYMDDPAEPLKNVPLP